LVSGWSLLPYNPAIKKNTDHRSLPNFKTIEFIRSLKINKTVNILRGRGAHTVHLGYNYKRIKPRFKNEEFDILLEKYKINMVILEEDVEKKIRFHCNEKFVHFLNYPSSYGFTKLRITGTTRYLFVKDDLLD
jgi:hypothetical protein